MGAEHSACRVAGGIGAYCAQMERACGPERLGFLLLGSPADLAHDRASVRWLFASELTGEPDLAPPQLAAEVLPSVVLLYPELRTVEGQDYLGVCAVAIQARNAGLLPPWLRFRVRCHGAQTYLEECFGTWRDPSILPTMYAEKVGLELADEVSFLSRYLERHYDEQGYRIAPGRRALAPYPFDFARARLAPAYRPVDTLIFFGKRTEMKGFALFLRATRRLIDRGTLGRIDRVIIVGRVEEDERPLEGDLAALHARLTVEEYAGTNAEVLALLAAEAARAVVVLPYRADNFPISVPEAVTAGCQILAARAGGIPEMIAEELHGTALHELDPERLADALERVAALDGPARLAEVSALQSALRERFASTVAEPVAAPALPTRRSTVGVIIPVYRTAPSYLEDLLAGLAHQTVRPDQVCLVDDGSPDEERGALERLIATSALPIELRRHRENRGLPAARNTGLAALTTDYVVNLDADDVPCPDFLRRYVDYLDADPEVMAVTSWLERFFDGTDFSDGGSCELIYRPLGDGLVLALTENCLGHANSAFRRRPLLELGGWDDSDRSQWEDYALFARILSTGGRIGVVPRSEILYRVRPESMARTYSQFPAQKRLARNLGAFPRFDALRLEGVMRSNKAALTDLKAQLDERRSRRPMLGWRRP
jgi:glycosyltransferase involved in cell wall biosynthesis/GT2 family glycosyltransferase